MVERGRSGVYVPVGMMHRSQMDATSPWLWMERKSEEACPDCLYERAHWPLGGVKEDETLSDGMIVSRSLPTAVRAVVIEEAGNLEKVVVNSNERRPASSTMRRLSGNLAEVSQAVAKLDVPREQRSVMIPRAHHDRPRNLVLDVQPQLKDAAARTVPELLTYMDLVASEMHLDLSLSTTRPVTAVRDPRRKRQSLLLSEDAEDLLTPWPANCAELEKDYWTARKQAPPATVTPPSVYTTAPSSRKPSLQPTLPSNEARNHDLPSAILRANDISSVPHTPVISPSMSEIASSSPLPAPVKPALRKFPRPTKRVRVTDVWPPARDREVPSPEKAREQDQLARVGMRMDRAKVVQEAAEFERIMRRRVKSKGGLGGKV